MFILNKDKLMAVLKHLNFSSLGFFILFCLLSIILIVSLPLVFFFTCYWIYKYYLQILGLAFLSGLFIEIIYQIDKKIKSKKD
tara:strand:- start:1118 stop:1366 length:249 start_codon:yes stop_codon:yes gene_type:complete